MANKEHLAVLNRGVEVWNEWRKTNHEKKPNLSGVDLSWIDLSEAILREAILMEAILPGVELPGVDLSEADLPGVDLSGADLSEVDLSGANLREANLSGVDLREANLSVVNLRESNLSGADLREANLSGADLRETNLSRTHIRGADLSEVDLSGVNLRGTHMRGRYIRTADLSGANLGGLNLSGLNLSGADLSKADLREANLREANLSGADLSRVDLSGADLSRTDLSRTDLSRTDLSGADLSGKDLSGVNFSETNLSRIQALGTNFERAIFTGACIEDWHTNSKTDLSNVICDSVYLTQDKQERRPSDPNKNFASGEFTKIFQEVENTAELIFNHGINWKAFTYAFNEENIQVYNTDGGELFLREYKALEDGLIVLKVTVPPESNKDRVRENLIHKYELQIASLEGELKAKNEILAPSYERLLLPGIQINQTVAKKTEMFEREKTLILQKIAENCPIKDSQIANDLNLDIHQVRVILNQLKESKFIESIEHKQSQNSNSPKINVILITEITSEGHLALKGKIPLNINTSPSSVVNNIYSGNFGIAHMSGGEINDGAKVAGVIKETEQQNLAEAAAIIQKLLKQLEQSNPTARVEQQQAFVDAAVDPTLKAKIVSALQAGWQEAIKEFLNNPYVNVGVAILGGWQEAE